VDEAGRKIGPYNMQMALADGQTELVGVGTVVPELGGPPATQLWAAVYDIDDNHQIDFGDFSFFAAAFGRTVGEPNLEPPYVWWADFDRSGRVDFGDLAFFAPNFGKTRGSVQSGAQTLVLPPNFPDAWRTGSGGGVGEGESEGEGETETEGESEGESESGAPRKATASIQTPRAPLAADDRMLMEVSRSPSSSASWKTLFTSDETPSTSLLQREPASIRSSAAARAERMVRRTERWEPFEDVLSLLAEQQADRVLEDVLAPHDALFTLLGE
jgi:hypothetical protein